MSSSEDESPHRRNRSARVWHRGTVRGNLRPTITLTKRAARPPEDARRSRELGNRSRRDTFVKSVGEVGTDRARPTTRSPGRHADVRLTEQTYISPRITVKDSAFFNVPCSCWPDGISEAIQCRLSKLHSGLINYAVRGDQVNYRRASVFIKPVKGRSESGSFAWHCAPRSGHV